MLDDQDIAKLCHGRIIKACFYTSSGRDAAGPHYAVILDDDDEVKEHDSYFAVVVSHNNSIDPQFCLPVPAHTGLTGFVQCSWIAEAHLAGITEIGQKLSVPEMLKIHAMIRMAQKQKAANANKPKKSPPTHS